MFVSLASSSLAGSRKKGRFFSPLKCLQLCSNSVYTFNITAILPAHSDLTSSTHVKMPRSQRNSIQGCLLADCAFKIIIIYTEINTKPTSRSDTASIAMNKQAKIFLSLHLNWYPRIESKKLYSVQEKLSEQGLLPTAPDCCSPHIPPGFSASLKTKEIKNQLPPQPTHSKPKLKLPWEGYWQTRMLQNTQ